MALLKSEPVAPVRDLDELFAIAHLMEAEAAERYADLGARMRAQDSIRLAEVFERLADEERRHGETVTALSLRHTGNAPRHALMRWQPPETVDMAGIDLTDPRLLTAYRALSVAVRNEERAFAFWSYVAAQATSTAVQQAAERMAHSELEHVALLRQERRRAFHLDRQGQAPGIAAETDVLEQRFADACERAAGKAIGQVADELREMALAARRTADELAGAGLPMPAGGVPIPAELHTALLPMAEILVDRYLEAAEIAVDEQTIAYAQAFAQAAIIRLAWLGDNLPNGPEAGVLYPR